ncbi:MAG TPA: hypothetical protein VMO47_16880 [Rhodothermales bacterium]|nr:hypothetical protein [Rhodothermales bacterium]
MRKRVTIARFTSEEIQQINRRSGFGIDWDRVNAMTEEEIERNALEDNRRLGIPDDWYKDAYVAQPVERDPDR